MIKDIKILVLGLSYSYLLGIHIFLVFVSKWLISGFIELHLIFYVTRYFYCMIRIFQLWKLKHTYVSAMRRAKITKA